MRKRILSMMLLAMGLVASAQVDTILINDVNYHVDVIESQDIGPGIHHYRLRIPAYPLNVNILLGLFDMICCNPYPCIPVFFIRKSISIVMPLVSTRSLQTV